MLKQATIYRVSGLPEFALDLAKAIGAAPFSPTAPSQQLAVGWIPPREVNGQAVEVVGRQWIARFAIETRTVPAATVQKRVAELCAVVEQQTGRKPGKKAQRELKSEALLELLPHAFPRRVEVPVWIDPDAGLLVIGTATSSKAERVISALVRALDGLRIDPISTAANPAGLLTHWLATGEVGGAFTLGRACELRAQDETKSRVRFANHHLEVNTVAQHVAVGKVAHSVELSHDGRVSFVLGADFTFRKIELLDLALEGRQAVDKADLFDADVALMTGTLEAMLADLIDEQLGGLLAIEPEPEPEAAASGPASDDELLGKARELVIAQRRASISLVQRHLAIG